MIRHYKPNDNKTMKNIKIEHLLTGVIINGKVNNNGQFTGVIVSNTNADIRFSIGQKIKTNVKLLNIFYKTIK